MSQETSNSVFIPWVQYDTWRNFAECKDVNEIPSSSIQGQRSTQESQFIGKLCADCISVEDCLADSLLTSEERGIRGGFTEAERAPLHAMYRKTGGICLEVPGWPQAGARVEVTITQAAPQDTEPEIQATKELEVSPSKTARRITFYPADRLLSPAELPKPPHFAQGTPRHVFVSSDTSLRFNGQQINLTEHQVLVLNYLLARRDKKAVSLALLVKQGADPITIDESAQSLMQKINDAVGMPLLFRCKRARFSVSPSFLLQDLRPRT